MADEAQGVPDPHPKLLNGFPAGQTPPTPLPGRTAQQVQWTIARLQFAASTLAVPIAFESFFKRYQPWYSLSFLAVVFILIGYSMLLVARGHGLIKAEMYLGYTTILRIARGVPGIFLFDPITKAVIAAPGEPRPIRAGTRTRAVDHNERTEPGP